MSVEIHEAVYRNTLKTAVTELDEIAKRVEQLRIRKVSVEKAADALKLLIEFNDQADAAEFQNRSAQVRSIPDAVSATYSSQSGVEPVSDSGQTAHEEPVDVLQRNINQALGKIAVA
jgi:hypothetical protein